MLLLLLAPAATFAAPSAESVAARSPGGPLKVSLSLSRIERDAEGHERRVPADSVKPGDLLVYTAVYTNDAADVANDVAATLPVPPGMEYQPRSAHPGEVLASTGDDRFAPEPLMRKVRAPDGAEHMQRVPYAAYRALRWQLGALSAGQSVEVQARVRVSADLGSETGARKQP